MSEMSSERLADIDRRLGAGGGYTGAPTKQELRTALIELVDEVRRQRREDRSTAGGPNETAGRAAMSEEQLAEIRDLAANAFTYADYHQITRAVPRLLAEVERLHRQAREDAEHTILVQQYGAQLLNERNDAQRQIDALVTSDKAKQGAADWMLNRLHDDHLIDDSTYRSLCGLLRDQIDATKFWTHSEDWGPLTDRLQAALKRAKTAEDQRDGAVNAWAARQDLIETERRRVETAKREARWMRLELRTRREALPHEETCHDCGHWLYVHREDIGCTACRCPEGQPPKPLEEVADGD